VIVSEIGIDMSRFPSANHLAAWAGVAPGNHESAGKRYSAQRNVPMVLRQLAAEFSVRSRCHCCRQFSGMRP
jgi:transposase